MSAIEDIKRACAAQDSLARQAAVEIAAGAERPLLAALVAQAATSAAIVNLVIAEAQGERPDQPPTYLEVARATLAVLTHAQTQVERAIVELSGSAAAPVLQ